METTLNMKLQRLVLPLMPSWFGMYIMPFLFMGLLKDYLLLPWFGLVVCQSSCPFQRCECRLPSNGSWSALASPLWWVKPDRWTDRCRLLLPSDSAGSACSPTTRLHRSAIRQAAVVCIQAAKDPFLSFFLLSLCVLSIYLPFSNISSCAYCSAFTHQPHNHKACPPWIHWHCARQPALSGESGYLVVLFRPFGSLWNCRR